MFPLSPTAAGYDESLEGYVLEGTLGKKAMLFWNGSAADGKGGPGPPAPPPPVQPLPFFLCMLASPCPHASASVALRRP